jgi:nitroreductase
MDPILSRRSIRKYTRQPVAEDIIEYLLTAAMNAPSAGNERPWHFMAIKDRRILEEIPKVHPYSLMLREAPLAILICGEPTLEKHKGYWVQDCSAATENLLIAATAKGLGSVWLGVYPREDRVKGLRKLLGIPEQVVPFSLIALGYKAEEKGFDNRYDAGRVHQDRW